MTAIPQSHIEDAHKLIADAKISLYKLYPVSGGTIYFKGDNSVTWLGDLYEGIPCELGGEKLSSDTSTPTPRLAIGQQDLDLLPFKGLINDGLLDGAKLVRHKVLLDNIINNINVKETTTFRVKRIESYSRTSISLVLATYSGATSQTLPHRQYLPPDFPYVQI